MSIKRSIVVLLAIIIVALTAYFFLHGGSQPGAPESQATSSLPSVALGTVAPPSFFAAGTSTANAAAVGSVSIVDAGPVVAYFIGTSSAATVVRTDGEIVSLNGGNAVTMSSSSVGNLVSAGFSHDGTKAVVSVGNPNNPQVAIFDVAARSWTSLSMGSLSPVWSPSGKRLAYLRNGANGTETVSITDFSGTRPSTVALGTFSLQDMGIAWVDGGNLALISRPSAYANGSALMLNVAKKTLTPIVADRPGFEATWSPTTSSSVELAFSADQSQRGGHLQLLNGQGGALQNVSFLTLPTKCVFAAMAQATTSVATGTARMATSSAISNTQYPTTSLFCAVPRDQTTLGYYDLPDAYEQHRIFTADDLYRINLANGHIDAMFADQSQNFDMANVSVVGPSFFFVNRYDGKLYAIRIQ